MKKILSISFILIAVYFSAVNLYCTFDYCNEYDLGANGVWFELYPF